MSESSVKAARYDRMNDLYDLVSTVLKEQTNCDGAEMAVVLTRVLGDTIEGAPPDLRQGIIDTLIGHLNERPARAQRN